jgi:hypothetical protein
MTSTIKSIHMSYCYTAWGSNPRGKKISRTRPDRFWGPSTLQYNGYRGIPSS